MADDYFQEIEAHFIARRGTPFFLNPKDWHLMQQWREAGIPLAVVIEAIDTVFNRFETEDRQVNGLGFCKDEVKKIWKHRRELTVGGDSTAPEIDPASRLEVLASALEQVPAIAAFGDRVRALAKEKSVPRIEESLIELESSMIEALLPTVPEIREEAESLVAGADEKSRARSLEAHVRRLVRERFGIPRLTMF